MPLSCKSVWGIPPSWCGAYRYIGVPHTDLAEKGGRLCEWNLVNYKGWPFENVGSGYLRYLFDVFRIASICRILLR